MKEQKRYYWIKLKTDFFNQETIDFLLSQENGCQYIVLYQMLCLNTANNNGEMATRIGEMIVPYDVNKIVRDTKYFNFDTVAVALELFKKLGLIYQEEGQILKIANFDEMVGSEAANANAQRQKRFREREKRKQLGVTESNAKNNANNVTENNQENRDKRLDIRDKILDNRDIEKDKEIEVIEGEIITPAEAADNIPYREIIDFLNLKVGSNYRSTTKKTKDLIKARFNEGFTIDDFKVVIDKKAMEWINDNKMKVYLRPETLFGTKFESYLNQPVKELTTTDLLPNIDFSDFYGNNVSNGNLF